MPETVVKKKSIFKSKTFWLNILGGAGMLLSGGLIPLAPATTGLILAGLNIVNRFLTNGEVSITGD